MKKGMACLLAWPLYSSERWFECTYYYNFYYYYYYIILKEGKMGAKRLSEIIE